MNRKSYNYNHIFNDSSIDFSFALFQYNVSRESRPKPVHQYSEVLQDVQHVTSAPGQSSTSTSTVIFSEASSISTTEISADVVTSSTLAQETEAQTEATQLKTPESSQPEVLGNEEIPQTPIESSEPEEIAVKAMKEMKSKLFPLNPEDDEILAFAAKNWAKKVLNSRGEVLFREGGLKLPESSNWTYEGLHTDSFSLWKLMTQRAKNARTVCKDYKQLLEKYTSTKTILNYIPRIDAKKCKGLGFRSIFTGFLA